MNKKIIFFLLECFALLMCTTLKSQEFTLGSFGYFRNQGVEVMAYDDIYPEGHQDGGSSHYMFLVLAAQQLLTNR